MSSVAVFKRIRKCSGLLGVLVAQQLRIPRSTLAELEQLSRRLRVFDATCLSRPGTKGTDWRLHMGLDLAGMCIDDAWLTSAKVGETFRNFDFRVGDIALADRAYGERRGIRWVVDHGADVVVRINWSNLPIQDLDGKDIDILEYARRVEEGKAGDWPVQTKPCPDVPEPVRGRLIILRKSQQQAEEARRKLNKDHKKKGKIDELVTRSDESCRVFILSKLLLALLIERLSFSPWGYGLPTTGVGDTGVCMSETRL